MMGNEAMEFNILNHHQHYDEAWGGDPPRNGMDGSV